MLICLKTNFIVFKFKFSLYDTFLCHLFLYSHHCHQLNSYIVLVSYGKLCHNLPHYFAFAWTTSRFAIVWVLHFVLLIFLPAVSRISEPAVSRILDLVMKWKATFVVKQVQQKMDWAILKTLRPGLSLGKSCFCFGVVQCKNYTNFQFCCY